MNMKRIIITSAALITALPALAAAKSPTLEMVVAGRGRVVIELNPAKAPKTVAHIRSLVGKRFYDGILIHRVEPNFVVQAGDPQTKTQGVNAPGIGSGGSGKNIPFEENDLKHFPGTIAMALSAPHSATGDSQWFINLKRNDFLDVDYCVFGKVVKGMDVVRKLKVGDKIVSIRESRSGNKGRPTTAPISKLSRPRK
jgi:cyclophilin family peptidyl-prolyl cis-trans isomerase